MANTLHRYCSTLWRVLIIIAPSLSGGLLVMLAPDSAAGGLMLMVIVLNGVLALMQRAFRRFARESRDLLSAAGDALGAAAEKIEATHGAVDDDIRQLERRIQAMLAEASAARSDLAAIRNEIVNIAQAGGAVIQGAWSSRHGLTATQATELVRLRQEGMTWGELGDRFGISPKTAKRTYDKAMNIARRCTITRSD